MENFSPEDRANIENTREKLNQASPLSRRIAIRTAEVLALRNEVETINEKEFPLAKMLLIDRMTAAQADLRLAQDELKEKEEEK